MLVLRLLSKLLKAVYHLMYAALLCIFAATWVVMKFITRNLYTVLVLTLLVRLAAFTVMVLLIVLKRR